MYLHILERKELEVKNAYRKSNELKERRSKYLMSSRKLPLDILYRLANIYTGPLI